MKHLPGVDLLADIAWEVASSAPGEIVDPAELAGASLEWLPAQVPGTAAGALRVAGRWSPGTDDEDLLDGRDWWWRCQFDVSTGPILLEVDGLATLAEVWVNGVPVLRSDNMFVGHRVELGDLPSHNEMVIGCAALRPLLERRRPRPRWKSRLARTQNLRWVRTTLMGRMPGWSRWGAPVGPWRPVRMRELDAAVEVAELRLVARCEGVDGIVDVEVSLRRPTTVPAEVSLVVGATSAPARSELVDGRVVVTGTVRVPDVERWWPHTHGDQRRYPVELVVDGSTCELRTVGFRTVTADRGDGGFTIIVNDVPVFCRGACWGTPDPVSLAPAACEVRRSLRTVRDAGMNMVRLGGYLTYQDAAFWDACDELGILVWEDVMLAGLDPPEDPDWIRSLDQELDGEFRSLGGRPSLAVVCGSSEIYQQAAMFGLSPQRWMSRVLEEVVPVAAERLLPGVPYLPSTPTGGDLPFDPATGVAHYFGVGAYLRPPSDARLAGVRFAAECLAFATPPEPGSVERGFASAAVAGHDPLWKATVARDAGTSWDFEDVRDHYVRTIFGVDPLLVRYADPDRALDLGRAVVAELMVAAMAEWRRLRSPTAGALVLTWQDLWLGAGWGLLDASGSPKAPWFALRRVLAPVAVTLTDDGLSGLSVHLHNDPGRPLDARLVLDLYNHQGAVVESAERDVSLAAHTSIELSAEGLIGGFRDLTRAYRFGPSAYDVVVATLVAGDRGDSDRGDGDRVWSQAVYLPDGAARPIEVDVGLEARARPSDEGWWLDVTTTSFAQHVALDVPGFEADDSWFHLPPGARRTLLLRGDPARRPTGQVRALNARATSPVLVLRDRDAQDDRAALVTGPPS